VCCSPCRRGVTYSRSLGGAPAERPQTRTNPLLVCHSALRHLVVCPIEQCPRLSEAEREQAGRAAQLVSLRDGEEPPQTGRYFDPRRLVVWRLRKLLPVETRSVAVEQWRAKGSQVVATEVVRCSLWSLPWRAVVQWMRALPRGVPVTLIDGCL
jgi:hypothetical protein